MKTVKIRFIEEDGTLAQDCFSGLVNLDEEPFASCEFSEENDEITVIGPDEAVQEVLEEIENSYGEIDWEFVATKVEESVITNKEFSRNFKLLKEARVALFTNKMRPRHKVPKTFGNDFATKAKVIKTVLNDAFVSSVMEIADYQIERPDIKAKVMSVVEESSPADFDDLDSFIEYVQNEVTTWASEQA